MGISLFLPGFWSTSRSSRGGDVRGGCSWWSHSSSFRKAGGSSQIRPSLRRCRGSHDTWGHTAIVGAGIDPWRRRGQAERSIRKHVVPIVHSCWGGNSNQNASVEHLHWQNAQYNTIHFHKHTINRSFERMTAFSSCWGCDSRRFNHVVTIVTIQCECYNASLCSSQPQFCYRGKY